MAISEDDNKLPFKKVLPYLEKVSKEVKNSELHIYPNGGHGFGLAYEENSSVSSWKNTFVNWIEGLYK